MGNSQHLLIPVEIQIIKDEEMDEISRGWAPLHIITFPKVDALKLTHR